MLIGGGYVVTNAHVVWPFQEVRVVFPDGSEFSSAPVLSLDLLGDLAVIGPLQTTIDPVELVDGEDLIIGSDVYLIGYPGEVAGFPQPTITRGIISRLRQWEPIEMTYFQTDAAIAGGQSGGVLVSEKGDVIGISGLTFTEAGFGLVASAADVLPRLDGLVAGEDVAGLGERRVPLSGGELESDFTLANQWDGDAYVVNEPAGTAIDIRMEGENDGFFLLVDVYGSQLILAGEGLTGVASGSATTELDAPYLIVAAQKTEEPGDFHVRSNVRLARYEDVDDGAAITVGQTVLASMDTPFDFDFFVLDLEEGETVEITVDSVMIDPVVKVDFPGATDEQVLWDDDSGGGLLGQNAKLTYRAPLTGSYLIVVSDATVSQIGGYLLTVAKAPPGASAVSPVMRPAPTTIDSPFGPMALYESPQYPFSIQYPADWSEQAAQVDITASFASDAGGVFAVAEEDTVAEGIGKITLGHYADLVESVFGSDPDIQVQSRDQIVTSQGQPAEIVVFILTAELFNVTRFIYLHEGQIGFGASYVVPTARHEEVARMIDYSFSTFRVKEPGQQVLDAAFYITRGQAYWSARDFVRAIQDYDEAIRLDPESANAYHGRGISYYLLRQYEEAVQDFDEALRLAPDDALVYNNRALAHVALGNFDQAVADAIKATELIPTPTGLFYLDVRGYAYLKAGEYEKARQDYDELIQNGMDHVWALLGGGLAYEQTGDRAKALELLEGGLDKAKDVMRPDLQLTDLMTLAAEALSRLQ